MHQALSIAKVEVKALGQADRHRMPLTPPTSLLMLNPALIRFSPSPWETQPPTM